MTVALLPSDRAPGSRPGLLETAQNAIRTRTPEGTAWLASRRAEAAAWLSAHGFPEQRQEAWRFTPMRDVIRTAFAVEAADLRVDAHGASGVTVMKLSEAISLHEEKIEPYLGRVAPLGDGFSALNGALWQDGIAIFAAPGAKGRIEIGNFAANHGRSSVTLPRFFVIAEAGAELTLIETHSKADAQVGGDARSGTPASKSLSVMVTEIVLGEGARLEHIRILDGERDRFSLGTLAVRQDRNSRYASRLFTFGGATSRLDLHALLSGEGAECILDGLYVAREAELVAHHTTVDHTKPHCSSRQRYKGAMDGTGTAVFDGTVLVRHGALRTEAHQENRNLLLSGDAVIHTKPHLRIDADDVKCSHGATVGRLDPAQLFYLRSRGMDASVARALLTYAFLREMTANVPEDLRPALEDKLLALLPDGAVAKELA
ncbi:MAG TPA: Fe-S cluster assembly protein SufD [Polyangiaceae bacterium]